MQKPERSARPRCAASHLRRPALLAALLLVQPSLGYADPPEGVPEVAAFWSAIGDPAHLRAARFVQAGRLLLDPALGTELLRGGALDRERQLRADNARMRFERAVALAPDFSEARLWLGKALARLGGEAREREAIATFEALRRRDPMFAAEEIAAELGLLYTFRGDFERARGAYERALALRAGDRDQALLLANLAELSVLANELPRARALYEQAIAEGEGERRVLALWGAALVHDRLGDQAAAMATALRAIREDRAPFAALKQHGVFFVPPHEAHYYEGLGELALCEAERAQGESFERALERGLRALVAHDPDLARALVADLSRARLAPTQAVEAALKKLLPREPPRTLDAASESLPVNRDARLAVHAIRALLAFTRHANTPGAEGHGREHAARLARALLKKE